MAQTGDAPPRPTVGCAHGPWVELRIHGVSGTPPESMLESAHVRQVAGDAWGRFFRPVNGVGDELQTVEGRILEGYHWGRYTSGSFVQGLWLILIPFGLVNAAAFMAPDPGRSTPVRWLHACVQATIRALALGVTATFALATGLIVVDLLAGHWAPGLPWLARVETGPMMAVGVVLAGLVVLILFWLGNQNRTSDFDPAPTGSLSAASDVGLGRETFFEVKDESSPILGRLHLSVGWSIVALIGALLWQTVAGHTTHHFESDLQHRVWWSSQALIVVLTVVVTFLGDPQRAVNSTDWRWHEGALKLVSWVAVGASGAVLLGSAAVLWPTSTDAPYALDVDHDSRWLAAGAGLAMLGLVLATAVLVRVTRPSQKDPEPFRPYAVGFGPWAATSVGVFLGVGFCAAFVLGLANLLNQDAQTELLYRVAYSWGVTLLLLLALLLAAVCYCWPTPSRRQPVSEAFQEVTSGARQGPLPDSWRWRVAVAQRTAMLKLHIGCFFILFAVSGWLMTAVTSIEMLRDTSAFMGWCSRHLGWFGYLSQQKASSNQWWVTLIANAGTYALISLAGLLFLLGRRALRTEQTRRGINVVWDVVSFWPHSAHPFVPSAYSQFAVHDLLRRIRFHLGLLDERPDQVASSVVVSAHSQGSLITFAAMLWLRPDELEHVGLVTYGSQLQVAYPRGFPAYVNYGLLDDVQRALGRRWVNLYRETDPIAGPVLSFQRDPLSATPPRSGRLGLSGRFQDRFDPWTGRRESGRDWRVLDPPPVDADLQVSTLVHLSRHSGYPASLDYPAALAHVRPT
jgi:hypothetical protein